MVKPRKGPFASDAMTSRKSWSGCKITEIAGVALHVIIHMTFVDLKHVNRDSFVASQYC